MIFSQPRYVNNPVGVAFKPQPKKVVPLIGPVVLTPMADATMGITLLEEVIPGPMPIFLPWIIIDPTSAGYYVW